MTVALEMLPAGHGDCLLLEFGPGDEVTHRILIDGGPARTYGAVRERLARLPVDGDGKRRVDLLVVSHIDGDHIEGVIQLLQDEDLGLEPADIWFNDWNHLQGLEPADPDVLGAKAGEFLAALLEVQGRRWNAAFGGGVIMQTEAPAPLPRVDIGGLELTILSPTSATLIALRRAWRSALRAAHFEQPGDRAAALDAFATLAWATPPTLGDETRRGTLDHAPANGSSIAFMAEYQDVRILFGADAFADVVRAAIERWRDEDVDARGEEDGKVRVDAFKLCHHGSTKNLTPQLLGVIRTPVYLVSTDGKHFDHPDPQTISDIIEHHAGLDPPDVRFNYRSDRTRPYEANTRLRSSYEADAIVRWDT